MINMIHDEGLPRLGWVAQIKKATLSVDVFHGSEVEGNDQFVVEGVWDGEFSLGDFHRSEHFFGTGLRIGPECLWLVPSSTLVDRLLVCEDETEYVVANSLVCLLAFIDAQPEPGNNYKVQADTILKGVDNYDPTYPISHSRVSEIRQYFYHPIRIDRNGTRQLVQRTNRKLSDYASYYNALKAALVEIRDNSKSPDRKKPFLAYTTISRGYDSTAVTALTHDLGIEKAFTSRRSSSGLPPWLNRNAAIDDGTAIAQQFGLDVDFLDYKKEDIGEDETLFLCPSPAEPEIVFYKAYREISEQERPSLLFTGYHGDKLWDKNLSDKYLNSHIIRGDTSGLNISEARLKAGFVNVPIPFMYADQIRTLHTIANSPELSRWSVGGDYDRPIPRRVAEELGVSREDFGTRKKAVISFYNRPINKKLRQEFERALKEQYGVGRFRALSLSSMDAANFYFKKVLSLVGRYIGHGDEPVLSNSSLDLPYKMYFWALQRQVKEQKAVLRNHWSLQSDGQAKTKHCATDPAVERPG